MKVGISHDFTGLRNISQLSCRFKNSDFCFDDLLLIVHLLLPYQYDIYSRQISDLILTITPNTLYMIASKTAS